jgi:hypothetical protein
MKKIIVLAAFFCMSANAQFKSSVSEQPKVSDSFLIPQTSTEWFSLFNPDNFQMHHSYSASYSTFGGQSLALQRYTNTMMYKFAPNLDARVDISLQNSPYSTLDSRLQNSFNSLYLNRAEINYRPWANTQITLAYRKVPYSLYGYGNDYFSPYNGMTFGLDDEFH